MAKRQPKQTHYERSEAYAKQVSGEIIEQIKKGTAPWQKPWKPGEQIGATNVATGKAYTGGNSLEGLRNNTNTSNTALAQSQVAGTVTQGNLTAAMAQLMAFQAAVEAAEDYEREIARREELARFVEVEREAQITFDAQQAGIAARVDSMREGLLFKVPALYGGPGQ